MNRVILMLLILCSSFAKLNAQKSEEPAPPFFDKQKLPPGSRSLNIDASVTTRAEVTIKGQRILYQATAGTQPVWDEEGKPIAGLFYTYYERTDIKDQASRPLVISFNGGPGTPSVWMEIGYTGPRRLNIDDDGNPLQPYGVKENPYSILDVADIVYVDPVNTGFSRPVNAAIPVSKFFGVNEDIKYLAEWISSFVTRKNRWASPKYLIGESYGTTRVSGLALELQDAQWMYLNGVILVSPTGLVGSHRGERASMHRSACPIMRLRPGTIRRWPPSCKKRIWPICCRK